MKSSSLYPDWSHMGLQRWTEEVSRYSQGRVKPEQSIFIGWLKTNLEPTTISSRNSENSKNPRTAQRGTRKITAGGSLQVQWSGGSLKEKNMAGPETAESALVRNGTDLVSY